MVLNSETFWKREPTQENNLSQVWNRKVPLSNKMVITDKLSNYMRMVEEIKGYSPSFEEVFVEALSLQWLKK